MTNQPRGLLQAACAALCLALYTGCAQQSPPGRPLTAADWKQIEAESAISVADMRLHYQTHDYKGLTVQEGLDRLAKDGFTCELSFVDTQERVPGTFLDFRPLRLPYMHCMRPEPPSDSLCEARQITLDVIWQDRAAPPEQLAQQYASSTIEGHGYRCLYRKPAPSSH